ncbi:MAG: RNA polymerase sigma factor [Candidatus Aminicenantes bacterium]|nr:RNA polymerase sigma factor [Candidatus Aminicenantes bacterium]
MTTIDTHKAVSFMKRPVSARTAFYRKNSLLSGETQGLIFSDRNEAVAALVQKHSSRLYALILKLVGSPPLAEDILQETWVLVTRKFDQYDPTRPILPWLIRISVNCCRSFWRSLHAKNLQKKDNRDILIDSFSVSSSDGSPSIDRRLEISKALSVLSPKIRETIVLKFYSGLTQEEIAETLGIPPGTVKSRLFAGLAKLRDHLNERGNRK